MRIPETHSGMSNSGTMQTKIRWSLLIPKKNWRFMSVLSMIQNLHRYNGSKGLHHRGTLAFWLTLRGNLACGQGPNHVGTRGGLSPPGLDRSFCNFRIRHQTCNFNIGVSLFPSVTSSALSCLSAPNLIQHLSPSYLIQWQHGRENRDGLRQD